MTEWTDEAPYAPDAVMTAEPVPLVVEPTPEGGEIRLYDFSGDQIVDTLVQIASDGAIFGVADTDGDLSVDEFGLDIDGDGQIEMKVTREGDSYRIQADTDGDGIFDGEQVVTREDLMAIDPTIVTALDFTFDARGAQNPGQYDMNPAEPVAPTDPAAPADPLVVDGQLVGDPQGDSEHWFKQAGDGYCVPASIAQIVSEYTGTHFVDEQAFVERANALEIFDVGPDGVPSMSAEGALTLLEDAGIPASLEVGTGVETLVQYLDEGRRVVLFIDSGELWEGEASEDDTPDHAVVVTGVDLERQVVIVSDPGHPAGDTAEYPIGLFENAWADAGFLALVCDVPPAEFTGPTAPEGTETGVLTDEQPGVPAPLVADEGVAAAAALPDPMAGLEQESAADAAISWAVENRWAVLPVVMGAAYLVGSRSARQGR